MSFVCVICEESLSYKDPSINETSGSRQVNTTQCGHVFHTSCLNDWFASQRRKQCASNNPQQQGLNKVTCPSCQRDVNPNQCMRIFPTEENEIDNIVPIPGVETKAELIEKISSLQDNLIQSETTEAELITSLQNIIMDKETLESDYQQLLGNMKTLEEKLAAIPTAGGSTANTAFCGNVNITSPGETACPSSTSSPASGAGAALPVIEPVAGSSTVAREVQTDHITPLDGTEGGLRYHDKVVWMHGDNMEVGLVLWLGKINGVITAGVEFVNPIGIASTIPVINGKAVFSCNPEYGRMVPVKELILYVDLYQVDSDTDETEPEPAPNGAGAAATPVFLTPTYYIRNTVQTAFD